MDNLKHDIIFNTINNGILILDEDLKIRAWNRWLEIHTCMDLEAVENKNLCELFPSIDEKKLKRKIKSVLVTNNSSFYSVDPHRYLIKIRLSNITNAIYEYMQQDVTIAPYKKEERLVAVYIYDKTSLCETNAQLEQLNGELKDLSYRDPMTHAYNRRYFYEEATRLLSLANREEKSCCIIIMDIDKFKDINDTNGHSIGDEVIIALAQNLDKHIRKSDVIARFGGEEFVILLYNSDVKNAQAIAEKIREDIQNIAINTSEGEIHFTASFGVSRFDKSFDQNDIEHTISRADKCLYVAKTHGRNKVITEEYLGASKYDKLFNTYNMDDQNLHVL